MIRIKITAYGSEIEIELPYHNHSGRHAEAIEMVKIMTQQLIELNK